MKIVWSEQARSEWAGHYRYLFARNPDAARRMRERVMKGVAILRDHPKSGRPGHVEGTRELVIYDTPYLVVYDESLARIEILHVHHGRQSWKREP